MTDEMWLAEPVTGHRYWTLDTRQMTLESAFGPWQAGSLEARCHRWGHESPHWPEITPGVPSWEWDHERKCMCGINAYKLWVPINRLTPENDAGELQTQVIGVTDLGGRVHEYDRGYRAQYGRIMEAVIISHVPYGSRFIGYLSDKYEAPFRVMSWTEYRKEWEATHGRDRETEEKDQDAEAGASPPGGTITYTGPPTSQAASQLAAFHALSLAQARQRGLPPVTAPRGPVAYSWPSMERSWWRRWLHSWSDDADLGWHIVALRAFAHLWLSAVVGVLVYFVLSLILT